VAKMSNRRVPLDVLIDQEIEKQLKGI